MQFLKKIITALIIFSFVGNTQAKTPLWSFTPDPNFPPNISIATTETATVKYTVTNHSNKQRNLVIKNIPGVTQSQPCIISASTTSNPYPTCTLILTISGNSISSKGITGGPALCQANQDGTPNLNLCYQPSLSNVLQIQLSAIQQFTVTSSAGSNGTIDPAGARVVNAGVSINYTATPASGYHVNQWVVNGIVQPTTSNNFTLSNVQANTTVSVTFSPDPTTLSTQTSNLNLSVNNNSVSPTLAGTPRIITVTAGTNNAVNVQVSTTAFPTGTTYTTTCTGTLNANSSCTITITPGATPSSNSSSSACNSGSGSVPVATVVTISADNATPVSVNVLILSYGCIQQNGYIFSITETPSTTASITGKVAALTNEATTLAWYINQTTTVTGAASTTDGAQNTNDLSGAGAAAPAARACIIRTSGGTGWYLPAICELGRTAGSVNCGTTNANLYSSLAAANLGSFDTSTNYWSSTQAAKPIADYVTMTDGVTNGTTRTTAYLVRCIKAFT